MKGLKIYRQTLGHLGVYSNNIYTFKNYCISIAMDIECVFFRRAKDDLYRRAEGGL